MRGDRTSQHNAEGPLPSLREDRSAGRRRNTSSGDASGEFIAESCKFTSGPVIDCPVGRGLEVTRKAWEHREGRPDSTLWGVYKAHGCLFDNNRVTATPSWGVRNV